MSVLRPRPVTTGKILANQLREKSVIPPPPLICQFSIHWTHGSSSFIDILRQNRISYNKLSGKHYGSAFSTQWPIFIAHALHCCRTAITLICIKGIISVFAVPFLQSMCFAGTALTLAAAAPTPSASSPTTSRSASVPRDSPGTRMWAVCQVNTFVFMLFINFI